MSAVAAFTYVRLGLVLDVDATTSTDAVSWDWDFGDSSTGSGETAEHTYAGAGSYNVVLTVTDASAGTDVHSQVIAIDPEVFDADPPPVDPDPSEEAEGLALDVKVVSPEALTVSVLGADPGEAVIFTVTGYPATQFRLADSAGVITESAFATPDSAAGTYTITALGNVSGRSASTTYTLTAPLTRPAALDADDPATDVAGADQGDFRLWVLQDGMPGGLGSWVFENNPSSMGSVVGQAYITAEHTTAPDGQHILWEGVSRGIPWPVRGRLYSRDAYLAIAGFMALKRRFYVIDHYGRAWVVAAERCVMTPQRKVGNPWIHDYDLSFQILGGGEVVS